MYDNNMIMSLKQKKRKFEPRIKLNHNICMLLLLRLLLIRIYLHHASFGDALVFQVNQTWLDNLSLYTYDKILFISNIYII